MLVANTTSQWRDRIIGLFKKEPQSVFPVIQIKQRLDGIGEPILNYHLGRLIREEILVRPKQGFYQLNPAQLKVLTPEEARAKVQAHIAENPRVVSNGEGFDPLKSPLTVVEGPALAARRLHMKSIIDRMRESPAFAASDVEVLLSAISPELRPAPRGDLVTET